jgi:Family of unknown function (DUF6326)
VASASSRTFGDVKVGVRCKIAALWIAIASVMVFLSLVLSPTVNRWTNIVLPSLYVVSIVASAIGETSAYYWFLSIAESALLLLIVWYAWTWPRREGTP